MSPSSGAQGGHVAFPALGVSVATEAHAKLSREEVTSSPVLLEQQLPFSGSGEAQNRLVCSWKCWSKEGREEQVDKQLHLLCFVLFH